MQLSMALRLGAISKPEAATLSPKPREPGQTQIRALVKFSKVECVSIKVPTKKREHKSVSEGAMAGERSR